MDSKEDCTSNSEQESENAITEYLRKEIKKSIENLDAKIETYVKREELPEAIDKCIQEKVTVRACPRTDDVVSSTFPVSDHEEVQFTVEFTDDSSNSRQLRLSEIFTLMERRISFLESRIGILLQMKGFRNISDKFKIVGETSEQVRKIEQRMASGESCGTIPAETVKTPDDKPESMVNPYDDLYYEWRQKKMNQLQNKKSESDLRLNRIQEIEANLPPTINRDCFVQYIKSQDVLD